MSNFGKVLKDEISRLARKQVRRETETTRRAAAEHRRQIAKLKRTVDTLQRRLAFLEQREKKRLAKGPATAAPTAVKRSRSKPRFSPVWLKRHREKLGLSAADYAKLIGVSPLSIYNWEHGKAKPRAKQIEALAAVRGIGKREAQQRLAVLAS